MHTVNTSSRITCEGFRTSRNPYFNIFLCEVNYCSLKLPEISFCEDLGSPAVLGYFDHGFCRTWKNQPMFSTYQTKFLTKFRSVTYVINRVAFERLSTTTCFEHQLSHFHLVFFRQILVTHGSLKKIILGATVLAPKSSNHCQVWSVLGPASKVNLFHLGHF